jgi:hypothetical protein
MVDRDQEWHTFQKAMEVNDSKAESEIDLGFHHTLDLPVHTTIGVSNLTPHGFGYAKRTYKMHDIREE